MLVNVKQTIADNDWIRGLAHSLFILGDSVRPIVQKPIVDRAIGDRLYEHALDAGCGRGLYTRILLDRAKKVDALDYSPENIHVLKRRLGHLPHLSLHLGSAENLPFEDGRFDLVIHCEVLEHIENDRRVLSELFRVLQPGGKLVISVPVPPAPIEDVEHVREGYTFEEIRQLLQEAGFEVIRHEYCMFTFSKNLMRLLAWWDRKSKFPLPSFFLIPVYWERFSRQNIDGNNLPYDVVIEAQKPDRSPK